MKEKVSTLNEGMVCRSVLFSTNQMPIDMTGLAAEVLAWNVFQPSFEHDLEGISCSIFADSQTKFVQATMLRMDHD